MDQPNGGRATAFRRAAAWLADGLDGLTAVVGTVGPGGNAQDRLASTPMP